MFNLHVKQYETLDKFEIRILFHSLTKNMFSKQDIDFYAVMPKMEYNLKN